jgi:hypothetical protein
MLSMEVRTGKTFTALMTAEKYGATHVLFITKKKAIKSITSDYNTLYPSYTMVTVNYESVHKIDTTDVDLVIIDESHSMGAFPKPSKRTKLIKSIVKSKPAILLSGTPTPESYSQIFHQFWISEHSPFKETNFYKWANTYVNKKKVYLAYGKQANDYSEAIESKVLEVVEPYMLSFTQKQAGFTTEVAEEVLTVPMQPQTYQLIERLENDLVFTGKNGGVILCDTPVKLMQKVHQLFSGTVKLEDGSSAIIDNSKAVFIRNRFAGQKIGIFYKFKAELELLQAVYGEELCTDLDTFNTSDKSIALQIVSGREGISLRNAETLVFFNIDFSATSYFQAKDRLTTMERKFNKVYWVFAKDGIEQKIYNTVLGKKNYTLKHYERSKLSTQVN